MKKTFLKDTFREIKKTLSRFIAILAIIALGTAFFVGVKTTCPDMKLTADKYYKEYQFMDFRIVSTAGFTNEDINAIKSTDGVKGVMPSYFVDAVTTLDNKQKVLRISSLPIENLSANNKNYINRPELISGRLPQKNGECVIEKNKMTSVSLNIGDKIKLSAGDGSNLSDQLVTDEYTVVGIINSPMYISKDRGTTTIGNGQVSAFVQIPDRDFKLNYYNGVYVTTSIGSSVQAYSKGYDDKISQIKKTLELQSDKRANLRYKEIKTDAQNILSDKQQEYNRLASEANKKLSDAQKKITVGQIQIDNGKIELSQKRAEFNATIQNANKQIADGKVTLASAQLSYQANLDTFNAKKQYAISKGVYVSQKAIFDANEQQLNSMKIQLDINAADLEGKQQNLQKSKADGEKQLEGKSSELNKAQADLNKSKSDFTRSKADSEQKLADGKKQLDDAQLQINEIPTVKWYVLDRNTNSGYVDYENAADRMDAIAQVFPVIFILVAILICFTSMSRMVEEQRTYMGTVKALGYNNSSIVGKFLVYAMLASIIGGIIGLAVGFTVFPTVLFRAYSILYTMPKLILIFDIPFAVISIIIGLLVTSLSAVIVCFKELNSNAATLMRPKTPKAGKVILLERINFIWKRLKFSQKVTMRNLIRYKSRFFMTVIGVGGCTALLLVGFGLNDAIKTIGDKQFGEIFTYQMTVNLKDNISSEDTASIINTIKKQSDFSSMQSLLTKSVDIGSKNIEKSCNIIVPDNAASINDFITLRSRTTNKKVQLTDDGVVITEKLANMLGINIGDNIYIKNGDAEKLTVKVTGVCENYLLHYVYMSPTLYKKLYKVNPNFNVINVKLKTSDASSQENVSKNIISLSGMSSVNLMKDSVARFNDTIKSIYNIVIILIVSAGLLSFIVLFTLTNININERIREIATIKVLGFYDNEVSSYVFKENLILTLVGTIVGLILGSPLAKYVVGSAEVEIVMFGRQIYPLSFFIAAMLTLVFAWVVNIVMLRRLKNINMVEALKTVE